MHTAPYLLIKYFEGNARDFKGHAFYDRTEENMGVVQCEKKQSAAYPKVNGRCSL